MTDIEVAIYLLRLPIDIDSCELMNPICPCKFQGGADIVCEKKVAKQEAMDYLQEIAPEILMEYLL